MNNNEQKINIIDAFCGAGGMSLGFKKQGYTPVFAFDNDPSCIATYNNNIGNHGFVYDAFKVNKHIIEKITGIENLVVDIIVGGPPCQGFSVQRRGSDKDHRNELVLEFIRLVKEFKPKLFIMENVSGLLSKRGKPYMDKIKHICCDNGYIVNITKFDMFDFGVPQHRKRVILIGQRKDIYEKYGTLDIPIVPVEKKLESVEDAIKDLQKIELGEFPNHISDNMSEINLKRIKSIKEGQGREHLPQELQLPCHTNNKNHRHLDTYGRMEWKKPSPTITARFDSFSRGKFGHPQLDRTISLREGARIQTFPDTFIFEGTKVQVAKQIGNAVPPYFSSALAFSIKNFLNV